ncbi:LuxR family transcriptional regulator [Nocardioides cavernaquae]|uniref:LuxR family transcriptional regulator n=2 Tax=Nocardioides cavernaquae TaxID=2321396 RepID=A0A3A5H7W2_9ACTN|nr:LuxR family transcriptional regulator [Nocardioides cavernaquae]
MLRKFTATRGWVRQMTVSLGCEAGSFLEGEGLEGRRRGIEARIRSLAVAAALPANTSGLEALDSPSVLGWSGVELDDQRALYAATEAAIAVVADRILPAPLLAARRVNLALERIQAATCLVDVLRALPSELAWAGNFDRVLFSRVEGSSWSPETWFTTQPGAPEDKAFGEFVHGATFTLASGSIEAEIVRRRVTALVCDAADETRTFAPLLSVAHCESYVIAPVVSGDSVVGLLHADATASGRALVEADRVTIRAFGDGIGLVIERLALLEALEEQRRQIHAALARAELVVDQLCDAPVVLTGEAPAPVVRRDSGGGAPADGLTSREREVFALLISGATNPEIADRLTVSETTVKSHVKHILRKMRVSNRAEAIAKHLRSNDRFGVAS